MGQFTWLPVFLLVASSLWLSGCQVQPSSTPRIAAGTANAGQQVSDKSAQGTAPAQSTAAAVSAELTPTKAQTMEQPEQPAANTGDQVPQAQIAGPGSGVMDNQSQVTGQFISQSPDDTAGVVRLHVKILTSKKVFGPLDFTGKFINKETDLYILAADLPALNPGDRFEAKVWFSGKEKGKEYRVTEITKLN